MRKTGAEILTVPADMSQTADVERFISTVIKRFGRLDVLVNNAGTSARGKFLEVDDATWGADLELKVFGAIRCSRLAIPHMKKQGGGRIINITISSAKQPGAESMPTSVSRAAGLAITKALSKEFAADNILVNTVCIGKIKSGQHERRFKREGLTARLFSSPPRTFRSARGRAEEVQRPCFSAPDARATLPAQHQSRRRIPLPMKGVRASRCGSLIVVGSWPIAFALPIWRMVPLAGILVLMKTKKASASHYPPTPVPSSLIRATARRSRA